MHKIRSGSLIGFFTLAILLAMQTGAMADNYKCKSTDGRIEYSDRPCDTSKESLVTDKSAYRRRLASKLPVPVLLASASPAA